MSAPTSTRTPSAIDPRTAIGAVHLTVSDLERSTSFYERALGLEAFKRDAGAVALGLGGEPPLIELHGDGSAPWLDRRATGLFHVAMLLPSRADLAVALARLAETRCTLDGASDHLVSEALYLSDPDGNGIEIYRDRPREHWPQAGGRLQMSTRALDLRDLAGELPACGSVPASAPAGTRIGHVHLQVSELKRTEEFYTGLLGFQVTVRGYPGALFVSAGGYHHHVGLNTWNSAGSGPPLPGAVGLRHFEVQLPDPSALAKVLARLAAAGQPGQALADGQLVRDPSGNAVLLRPR